MSIQPSSPGEVINVGPLGGRLETTPSSTLIETDQVKVIRMVMKTGKALSEHKAPGLIMVQCLEGRIEFMCRGKNNVLTAGSMLYLENLELHSLNCLEAGSFLLTIVKESDFTSQSA